MTPAKLPQKQLLSLAAILVLSLMFATSILTIPPSMAQETYDAYIIDLSFNPQVLCIEKHDTVVWANNDPVIHTLWFVFAENQSSYLLSDPIAPGESWSHTFDQPVKLLYYDFERLWITGKLKIYTIFGDVDGDGDVDWDDLVVLAGAYGLSEGDPGFDARADFDLNGKVDWDDLVKLAGNYGKKDP